MNDPDIHALSGAYAVDALDDLERARFERHLDLCASCREEVASLQASATQLGDLTATTPPPALRASILDEIRHVRPLPPETPSPAHTAEPAPRKDRRRTPWRTLLVAACLAGVVGAGAAVVSQVIGDETTQTLSVADRVLAAPDARSVSAALPGGATARVVHSISEGKAVLVASGMPQAPAGKIYELWLQNPAGDMIPAGLMEGGDAKLVFDGDASRATAAGITVEPAGGSEQPTSAPIALFDFAKAT